jgi:hypothetical protein
VGGITGTPESDGQGRIPQVVSASVIVYSGMSKRSVSTLAHLPPAERGLHSTASPSDAHAFGDRARQQSRRRAGRPSSEPPGAALPRPLRTPRNPSSMRFAQRSELGISSPVQGGGAGRRARDRTTCARGPPRYSLLFSTRVTLPPCGGWVLITRSLAPSLLASASAGETVGDGCQHRFAARHLAAR